ncbi:unnamed protein product [Ceratitis capitata]|uniref:(Mediterranean fruit fly) hypothetical protein n=1 Tax=Ceratitis capitata TaxID=7213 RepID=A0A811V5R3_CERCA|nr:unnamed protein product [Ceratitis capitata]
MGKYRQLRKRNRENVLDITTVNIWPESMITQWMVSPEPSMSDLRIIQFSVDWNFCEGVSSVPEDGRLHKAHCLKIRMEVKLEDDQYTKNEKERAMVLLRTHFPDSTTDAWLLAKKIINYSSVE